VIQGESLPMAGALPVDFFLETKPQGHGYTILEVTGPNPYYAQGTVLKGHEFHYSRPVLLSTQEMEPVFQVRRGHGLDGTADGLCRKNLLGLYTHIHATGTPMWAEALVKKAGEYRELKGL